MLATLVRAEERSVLESNAPSVEQITTAFRSAAGAPVLSSAGVWVGPSPRVVRSAPAGAFVTRAAWLWKWNAGLSDARRALLEQFLESNVALQLARQSPDWNTARETYAPATHGTEEWWSSGRAAVSSSAVEFPAGTARVTDPAENPIGPSDPNRRPRTPAEALNDAINGLKGAAAWAAVPLGLGLALLYFGPSVASAGRARAKPARAAK